MYCLLLGYSWVFERVFFLSWVTATVPAADLLCLNVKSTSWAAWYDTWLLQIADRCSLFFSNLFFPFLCEEHDSLAACAGDLKDALTVSLNRILQPVRDHFENNAEAAALLKKVKVRVSALPSVHCQHTPRSQYASWHAACLTHCCSAALSSGRFGSSCARTCVNPFVLDAVLQGDQVGEDRYWCTPMLVCTWASSKLAFGGMAEVN